MFGHLNIPKSMLHGATGMSVEENHVTTNLGQIYDLAGIAYLIRVFICIQPIHSLTCSKSGIYFV